MAEINANASGLNAQEDANAKAQAAGVEGGEPEAKKSYTQEELDKLIQAETDRRVTQAMKKAEEKTAAKVREAQKLAAMDAQQRFEYELSQREAAIVAKEAELSLAENKTAASKILSERGISLDLVDFVVSEEAEDMNRKINILDKAFKASVKAEVDKRLAGNSPKKNLGNPEAMSKADFKKLSLTELTQLKQSDPELYNQLKGR